MAILIDLDDTLVDRELAFARWATKFVPSVGGDASDVAELIAVDREGYAPRSEVVELLMQRFPNLTDAEALLQRVMFDHLSWIEPYDGVVEQFQRLRRSGHSIIVVTNGTVAQQSRKVERAGLARLVDDVVISEGVGHYKPAPEIFARALQGVPRDETTWMIGDNPANDIGGGQRAGLFTGWVSHGREWPGGVEPTIIAPTTAEVLAQIE